MQPQSFPGKPTDPEQLKIGRRYKVMKGIMAGYTGKVLSITESSSGRVYSILVDKPPMKITIHQAQIGPDPIGSGMLTEIK